MKAKTFLLCLCLCCLLPTHAQTIITEQKALSIAMQYFQGVDVDYYSFVPAEDFEVGSSSTTWNIFVDAEPMKGWEHNCYVITIPKSVPAGKSVNVQTVARRLPPAVTMRPLSVKNRYGSNLKK